MGFRGIQPDILISQVRNTMPFLFDGQAGWLDRAPHVRPLLEQPAADCDGYDYFRLCLVAHHATVSTYVPTDVDNQIRLHLWRSGTPLETLKRMAELVIESRAWDYRPLSARWVTSPSDGRRVSGHAGEWLSTAVGAYGALRSRAPELARTVAAEIEDELALEAAVFVDLVRARDGLGALRACTLIAHNLSDLNRVIEMWSLEKDPATDFGRRSQPALAIAAELNRVKMAAENHRHLALRRPRCLRQSADFFLPLGPFLDDWGMKLASHPGLSPEDIAEVTEALLDGLERTPGSIGYTRAIAGIESSLRGGASGLQNLLPAKEARKLKSGPLRPLIAQRREHFEQQWSQFALQFCRQQKLSG